MKILKNLITKYSYGKTSKISENIISSTHEAEYIDLVKNSFPSKGFSSLDGDTIISPGSKKATFDASSIIAAIDGVQNKEFKNAFCSMCVHQATTVIKIKLWFLYFK